MKEFHLQLQVPLRKALADLQEPEPEAMAELIDSHIVKASHGLGGDLAPHQDDAKDHTLASLRRLVGSFLGLAPETWQLIPHSV